jgi:hypothetical protein
MNALIESVIYFNTQYNLAICKPCGSILPGIGLARHFRTKSHAALTTKERTAICDRVKEWNVISAETFYEGILVEGAIPAIKELPIYDVNRCNECGVVLGDAAITKHCNTHEYRKGGGNFIKCVKPIVVLIWTKVKAQTVNGNNKYFVVTTDPDDEALLMDKDALIKKTISFAEQEQKQRYLERNKINNEEHGKESPWLNYTGWQRRFAGEDMERLMKLIRLHIGDNEAWLQDIPKQVTMMLEHSYQGT